MSQLDIVWTNTTFILLLLFEVVSQWLAATGTRTAFIAAAAARGGASFRRADAAQVCNHVVFSVLDGPFECSFAIAARQIVSERW